MSHTHDHEHSLHHHHNHEKHHHEHSRHDIIINMLEKILATCDGCLYIRHRLFI